jgi:hypothetical protein
MKKPLEMLKEIKSVLGIELYEQPVAVSLATMMLEDGATTIEAEEFAPDFEVFIVTEEDRIPMPVGDYPLEDGMILVVETQGLIMEIKEDVTKEAPPVEDAPVEEVAVDAKAGTSNPKKIVESITKEMFFSEIEKLRTELKEIKADYELRKQGLAKVEEALEIELAAIKKEELSTPAAKAIKHSPENGKITIPKGKLSLKELLNTLNK